MEYEMKQKGLEHMEDKRLSDGGEISTAFNHESIGRPFSGHGKNSTADAPKYKIFDGHEVGEHFGRSGSPKGHSPRI